MNEGEICIKTCLKALKLHILGYIACLLPMKKNLKGIGGGKDPNAQNILLEKVRQKK